PNLGARHFHPTALTDDALVADALVLAAVALPVLLRAEDALVEETVLLRLEGAVVDRFGLLHLAVGPGANLVRGGEPDLQFIEHLTCHVVSSLDIPLGAG